MTSALTQQFGRRCSRTRLGPILPSRHPAHLRREDLFMNARAQRPISARGRRCALSTTPRQARAWTRTPFIPRAPFPAIRRRYCLRTMRLARRWTTGMLTFQMRTPPPLTATRPALPTILTPGVCSRANPFACPPTPTLLMQTRSQPGPCSRHRPADIHKDRRPARQRPQLTTTG